MFALRRLLLLFLIIVAAYCFWPRSPSISNFDPQRMAELQITVWKKSSEQKKQDLILPLYELYDLQYHLPPISALKMAFDTARALQIFHAAPDSADQEKALVPLQTVFVMLKSNVKGTFDSAVAARLELMTWMLRAEHAKRGQLTSAWSEQIALLYGRPAEDCLPAAKKFAIAVKMAEDGNWSDAKASALEGWKAIKELSPPAK